MTPLYPPHEPPRVQLTPQFARICLNFLNSQQAKALDRSRLRSPTRTLSQSPTHPSRLATDSFSNILPYIWDLHKTGPLRSREIARSEVI